MRIRLKEMRKKAGIKSQSAMAEMLGVPERRYSSWERGEAMPNLEQAYNCALVLGCTIDDIAGLEHEDEPDEPKSKPSERPLDRDETELVENYRSSLPQWKANISMTARAAAGESRADASRGA